MGAAAAALGRAVGVAARFPPVIPSPPAEEEEEVALCPLCLEELDLTDTSMVPCHCGYQVRF